MTDADLKAENEKLRRLLEDSQAALSAIRNGEVDALVVGGKEIYTLQGADHPYRILVEAMQQGAVTISPAGVVIYCNGGFAQMIGRPPEKIVGVNIGALFSSMDRELLMMRLEDERSTAQQTEMNLIADDGSSIPVVVSINHLPLDDFFAICLVITDLTEHKKNQQLLDTDRRKDEFLAMLAHELRNPLAPISNAIQTLQMLNRQGSQEVQWVCDVVGRQVRQMTRIVDDLLDVSRITRGKVNLQKQEIEIAGIVSAAVETSRPLIEARRHTITISHAVEPLTVNADPTRMAQVLTNLLNNSAKYTDEGGEIALSFERDGDHVRIVITDNGTGIAAELLPTVFDLFTQADRTADRSQGGLGIGLTLVRKLVELHGGTVAAASAGLGRGSEFCIRLPLVSNSAPHVEFRSPSDDNFPTVRSRRILVVDDNIDSAESLAKMLRAVGHDTMVAHDGISAIQLARSTVPELILLDIGLPGMNGYMVAAELRAIPALRNVLIAALTGYGDERDRQRSKDAGFDEHFVKPCSILSIQLLLKR